MILEQLGIAHIPAKCIHRLVLLTSIILKIDAPRLAADVRKPERSECPEKIAGSSPTRSAWAFTTAATPCALSLSPSLPPFLTERNRGRW
jgi:hypothetical protein